MMDESELIAEIRKRYDDYLRLKQECEERFGLQIQEWNVGVLQGEPTLRIYKEVK